MAILLEALDGPGIGRSIMIRPGRPRVFKVVKHGHEAGEITITLDAEGISVVNRSQRPLLINGEECIRGRLQHGDTVSFGKDSYRIVDETTVAEVMPAADLAPAAPVASEVADSDSGYQPSLMPQSSSDTERQRRRKSISASMPALAPPPRSTLMNRVSSVFSAKARAERSRVDELAKERLELLAEAGRQALSGQAFGLTEQLQADLFAGRTVTITGSEIARGALERWRELTQRVTLVDAEIAATRRALGLEPDPEAVRASVATRGGLREREERVFASFDSLKTQEIDMEAAAAREPRAATNSSQSSAGKMRIQGAGRRRRD